MTVGHVVESAVVSVADPGPRRGVDRWRGMSVRFGGDFFVLWMAVAVVCALAMWQAPGDETIPYHIAWAGFALAFGARVWSSRQTWVALFAFTLVTGGILLVRVGQGVLAWQEAAEIPLMSMLMALLVWNVRRRQDALATVTELAEREADRAQDREMLTRLTSHEMRSPLTIADGYVQLMTDEAEQDGHDDRRRQLRIVHEELDRLGRTTDRLIRVIQLQNEPARERVDLDQLVEDLVTRWSGVTKRRWLADADVGRVLLSPDRWRACLDTLVENAVRYTMENDIIRVYAARVADEVHIGVADSGPGLSPSMRDLLNDHGAMGGFRDPIEADNLSQTGLGLGLVRSAAVARGGRLVASVAPEGGADVGVILPDSLDHAASTGGRSILLAD